MIRCWGLLLVWLLLRVHCRAWRWHAVSTRCATVARWGLLSAPLPWVWAVRGVVGVVLPAVVCCVSCFLLCAAADCACCLQSLLLAAGSLRSRLCPDASSALCSVLHTASHLDVSHLKTRSGKPLHPSKSNGLQSKTSKAQTTAPQSPTCHSSRPRHSHSTRCRHLPAGATTRQAHGSQRQLANREVQTRPPPRRNVGA